MTVQIFSTEIKILDLVYIGPDPVVKDCSIDLDTTVKKLILLKSAERNRLSNNLTSIKFYVIISLVTIAVFP
jgi:hypothetical protein